MADTWEAAACPMPPSVRLPKLVQGVGFAVLRRTAMRRWITRYGRIFQMDVPFFGRSVVVSDPALVKAVCAAGPEQLSCVQPNIGNWFGPGSVFGLDGPQHRQRRQLLAPSFHGQRLRGHEEMIEAETLRECVNWPERKEFRVLEPMNRITLNVILRVLFGADGVEVQRLRDLIPAHLRLGQLFAFVPGPPRWVRRVGPWSRLDRQRAEFDGIVRALTVAAAADPGLDARTDVLAVMVRAGLPQQDVCDELLTLVAAGQETTASALGWTFERLRRHPGVLAELVREVDEDGSEFRRATIMEALRVRSVIDVAGRRVGATSFDLGGWRIPHDRNVIVRIADLHHNPECFADPERFDPGRFLGSRPTAPTWLTFGGGARRCFGADFATTQMDVVLRTVLQHFTIESDDAADERSHFRGVANVPGRGGRIVVRRRPTW